MRCGGMGTLRCSMRTTSAAPDADTGVKRGRPSSSRWSTCMLSGSSCGAGPPAWGCVWSEEVRVASAAGASSRSSSSWGSVGRGMSAAGSWGAALRAVGAGILRCLSAAGCRDLVGDDGMGWVGRGGEGRGAIGGVVRIVCDDGVKRDVLSGMIFSSCQAFAILSTSIGQPQDVEVGWQN